MVPVVVVTEKMDSVYLITFYYFSAKVQDM